MSAALCPNGALAEAPPHRRPPVTATPQHSAMPLRSNRRLTGSSHPPAHSPTRGHSVTPPSTQSPALGGTRAAEPVAAAVAAVPGMKRRVSFRTITVARPPHTRSSPSST